VADIVALLDADAVTAEKRTVQTLRAAEQAGTLRDCTGGSLPKSLIVTPDGYYFAAPNTTSLRRKMQ
jgi:hypothetical protein